MMIRIFASSGLVASLPAVHVLVSNEQLVIVSNFLVAITTLLLFWVSMREMLQKMSKSQRLMLKLLSLFISENPAAKHRKEVGK